MKRYHSADSDSYTSKHIHKTLNSSNLQPPTLAPNNPCQSSPRLTNLKSKGPRAQSSVPNGGPPGGPGNELHKWGVPLCLRPHPALQLRHWELIIVHFVVAFFEFSNQKFSSWRARFQVRNMGPDLCRFGKDGNKNGCRFPDPKTEQLFEKMAAEEKMFCALYQILLHSLMSTSHLQARPQTL